MEKDINISEGYCIETHMKPGRGFEDICKMTPQNMKDDSILIVCAGTNDLYRTEFNTFKSEIDKLSKLKQKVIVVGIPPQTCENTNIDIMRLNTRVKHLTLQYENIEYLQTHSFIKPHHLARDGVHLGRNAKRWLAIKIIDMITRPKFEKKREKYHEKYNGDTHYYFNSQSKKSWPHEYGFWENGKFFPSGENGENGLWINGNYFPHNGSGQITYNETEWPELCNPRKQTRQFTNHFETHPSIINQNKSSKTQSLTTFSLTPNYRFSDQSSNFHMPRKTTTMR
uniref:Uncharacterized protein n=1 Tax=Cacopsylla melanoneura TaxID=428564 RepID=A0A8D8ZBY7_9HEMI